MTDEKELPDVWIDARSPILVGGYRFEAGPPATHYVPAARLDALREELTESEARAARLADWIDELLVELEAAKQDAKDCDLLLSRVLHELAGAASLCWEPKPTGVFEPERAIVFVEEAINELRAVLRRTAARKDQP